MIAFTVLGRPQPAGSKKAFQHKATGRIVVIDDAKKSRPWKQQVGDTALAHRPTGGELLAGPLALELVFYVARPKSHYGKGRNAGVVKPSASAFPTVKPDTTKLVRAVEDALTGVLWRDDAQVVDQVARKRYGTPERVEVLIVELEAVSAAGSSGGTHDIGGIAA